MDVNIREAAKAANLAVPTIRQLMAKRQFPYYRHGKKIWFDTEEILRWREARHFTVEPQSEAVAGQADNTER